MLSNKKASLEISIQAIVIVVLAMTLLGLGLGFIRGIFGDIKKTTEGVAEGAKRIIIDDLISNDRKLSFPKTDITLEKGGSEVLAVGIRNKKDEKLNYKMNICAISRNPTSGDIIRYSDCPDDPFNKWFQFSPTTLYSLGVAGEPDIRGIKLNIPSGTPTGSYYFTFSIYDQDVDLNPVDSKPDLYAQQDFFVVVRG